MHKRIPVENKGFYIAGIPLLLAQIAFIPLSLLAVTSEYDAVEGVGCVRVNGVWSVDASFKFRMTVLTVLVSAGCSLISKFYSLMSNERRYMESLPHFKTTSKLYRDVNMMIVILIICVFIDFSAILVPSSLPDTWPRYPTNVAHDIVVLAHSLMLAITIGMLPKTCCQTLRRCCEWKTSSSIRPGTIRDGGDGDGGGDDGGDFSDDGV